MEEFKTLEKLKEEFGKNYDIKLYEIGISAMKEIARLNKIIDELENWVNMQIDFLKDLGDIPNAKNIINEHTTMVLTYQNILDKLKELKEGGKE